MHLCPDEIVAVMAVAATGPVLLYRYFRHKVGCFCRWCARLVRR